MFKPKISICIPTYNREKYLDWQLSQFLNFKDKISDWEFVISNNGSSDNTKEIIDKYRTDLKINYHEFSSNVGAEINTKKALSLANSDLVTYLADDDFLNVDVINAYLNLFNESPKLSAIFAPGQYLDAVDYKTGPDWYSLDEDVIIPQKDYLSTIELILNNNIFPELFIVKKNIAESFFSVNNIIFEYFTWCAQIVSSGNVIFAKHPFYALITRHPADQDKPRAQNGNIILQTAWDRYKGGFELILGLARLQNKIEEYKIIKLLNQLNNFVLDRMVYACRSNLFAGNFLSGYWLYLRIVANIGKFNLNEELNFDNILGLATIEYVLQVSILNKVHLGEEINQPIRLLANKFSPNRFFLKKGDLPTINLYSKDPSILISYQDSLQKLNFL